MLTNKNWTEHAQKHSLNCIIYIYDKKKNLFFFSWIRDIIDLSKSIYNVDFA